MSNVDEGPPKRLKTEATMLASLDEGGDYAFTTLDTDSSVEKENDVTEIKLNLEQRRIETWWNHLNHDHPVNNSFLDRRMMILNNKGLRLQFSVPKTLQKGEAEELLEKILLPARTIHLDNVELYFAEDDDDLGPFSLRNELEALNSILLSINSIYTSERYMEEALIVFQGAVISRIVSLEKGQREKMSRMPVHCDDVRTAKELLVLGKDSGIVTKLDVACFKEAGRGLVASEDIDIGDVALEVPMDLVISDDFIESDLPDSLKKPNLSQGSKRFLWIMKEKSRPREKFRKFFESLREGLKSGAWFGCDAKRMAAGTPLVSELFHRKLYLESQFRSEIEPILEEHPAMFESGGFNEFMFAWEVWNSHSVSIVFSGEKLQPCLVPIAGFFNHSQCPHVLYGKHVYHADTSQTIQFIASRPCKKGMQCYLSYGNLSGAEFMAFYGFLPKGVNYHDVVRFEFGDDIQMAKGRWPYSGKSGLTKRLVKHVRAVLESQYNNPEDVYDVLMDIFMLFNYGLQMKSSELDQLNVNSDGQDVKLAYAYREHYVGVLSGAIFECARQHHPEDFVDHLPSPEVPCYTDDY